MNRLNKNIVGKKLDNLGNWRDYSGNTIASFLVGDTSGSKDVIDFRKSLIDVNGLSKNYVFTSLQSLHMTVFDLISDQDRNPETWPGNLDINCSLEDSDKYFKEIFDSIAPPVEIVMKPTGVICSNVIIITLKPLNLKNKLALDDYRSQISKATGMSPFNKSYYRSHITLAYQYLNMREAELHKLEQAVNSLFKEQKLFTQEIRLTSPNLLFFNSMNIFSTSR